MYAFRVTDEAEFSAHYGDTRLSFAAPAPAAPFIPSASYAQQARRPRGMAMAASALAVGVLFSAMVWMNVAPHAKRNHHIVTMDLTAPPPAKPESKPVAKEVDMPSLPQQVAQPQPDAPTPPLAVAVPVGQEASAQPPAPPAPPAPAPAPVAAAPKAPAGPAEVGDLGARILSFSPPSYPLESRRNMEEGTVTLALLVGTDGRVVEISVAGSSGFARLDKAALEAVRKWRWTPMMRGGEAVMLRGFLKIPFGLKK